jgi:phage terminase small subunit
MPPLNNNRHERFCQFLLQGESATDAHEHAGFVRDDGNATRLRQNPKVQARLAELQAEVAKKTTVTVEGLINELEEARQRADSLHKLSAVV